MADIFRKNYSELKPHQKTEMDTVKLKAQDLWDTIEEFVPNGERSERARLVNIGKTHLEIAIAMIVKGITTPEDQPSDL